MITRSLRAKLIELLTTSAPAVALLGPRQVGKTTLALNLSEAELGKKYVYLDLELDSDLAKLDDPEAYLKRFDNCLVIIDEAQRKPDLFRLLRGLIDQRKRKGEKAGQFLLLGSASRDLLQQSSESLAGRIRYLELTPLTAFEIHDDTPGKLDAEKLWSRGGFPDSYLAASDDDSWEWRTNFINTYLERDIPLMGPNISTTKMKRLWTMLAHNHGQQVNLSNLGKSLETSHTTIRSYIDILTDFYMLRQLQPWAGNTKKRLVKSPKIYVRDTGLLHSLLNIYDIETLLGHPTLGASWEGFVIESIVSKLSSKWQYSYYRTNSQSEIDLILEGPKKQKLAIEIKRSTNPKISSGFHHGCDEIQATRKILIHAGDETYPKANGIEAFSLIDFLEVF